MSEITKLKIDYSKMAEQIKNLCKEQGEIKDDLRAYITEDRAWKENFSIKLDEKYAGKWIEKISVAAFSGLIVGVVLLLLGKV